MRSIPLAFLMMVCGAGPVVPVDASRGTMVAEPAPPLPPAPTSMGPCAAGWREVTLDDGTPVCEPWAGDSAPTCADTELALPGSGCEPVDVCPADGWPTDLPSDAIYVRAGEVGGDGTRAHPFG